jgi:hypothetical protein
MSRLLTRNPRGQFTKVLFVRCDKVFDEFSVKVIKQAKKNLKHNKHRTKYKNIDASGNLSRSLRADTLQKGLDFALRFWSEDYGTFIEEGVRGSGKTVRGAKAKSNKAPKSPYTYKSKMPPRGMLDRWGIKKGIKGTRGKDGKFIPRKSMMYLIQRSIFQRGIEPSYFYGDAFDFYYKQPFIDKIETAYALDVEDIFAAELQEQLKN